MLRGIPTVLGSLARIGISADGWLSFYWGQTIQDYHREDTLTAAIMKGWLRFYKDKKIEPHP